MNIHEYQAKQLFSKQGITVPLGRKVTSSQEAEESASFFSGPWVLKAQIHAGGRGKAGGIQMVERLSEVAVTAERLLGQPLVTRQTGSGARTVHKILLEEKISIQKEYYLALAVDRQRGRVALLASPQGGVDIEEIVQKYPDQLKVETVDPMTGILLYQARRMAQALQAPPSEATRLLTLMTQLYKLFIEVDATLIEINPLVLGKSQQRQEIEWIALDAKMSLDDNALYRHPDLAEWRDLDEEDPSEISAAKEGLSYILLEGNIGCMVNGAGLAMATLDEVKNDGLEPANFLDVGGGAGSERVAKALQIITADPRVKAILINIFGGITQCDEVARGVINALRGRKLHTPLVVRLEGTRVEEGRKLFKESGLAIESVSNLSEAAQVIKIQLKSLCRS